jgi:hypothetical protein
MSWRKYRLTHVLEATRWAPGFDMSNVNVSPQAKLMGCPRPGDMIMRDPKFPDSMWLVPSKNFDLAYVIVTETYSS